MMAMDEAIQRAFPLVAAPSGGALPPATANGVRYVVDSKGIWREVTLPWVRALHMVGVCGVPLPYGSLEPKVVFLCGPLPRDLLRMFRDQARDAAPVEIAAALVWNARTSEWYYQRRQAISASSERIDYREIDLGEDEHLVVDIHSHGHAPAFFSALDDSDDFGAMRVSLVLGCVAEESPSSSMRLCLAGAVFPLRADEDGYMEVGK